MSNVNAPPISRGFKTAYGIGSTAEAIVYTTTSSFLLLFYNQVQGVSAEKVGLALAIGLIFNAIFDPVVGSWSDRIRSRFGRRHAFMFASILPNALCFLAVFNPPDILAETGTLIWLGVFNTLLLQMMSLFHTPHLAFGGELSEDYLERSSVMNYNTFLMWVGDSAGWILSFGVFFKATTEFPNGALDPDRWPLFSIAIATIIVSCLAFSSFVTYKRVPFVRANNPNTPTINIKEFLKDIYRALCNRNYVVLLIGFFFQSMMVGVRIGLWIYIATFFWQLTNDQITWFVLGSFSGYLFAAFVVKRLHKRFDKRWTGAAALLMYSVGPAIPLALGYFGIISSATPGILWILIAFSVLQHAPYSLLTTTIYSALADIADENELKFGVRQEGVLYATRTLFARIDQAIGTALAGWVIAYVAFPDSAVPGEVSQIVLDNLAAAFVITTIPGLIAVVFYGMVRVTQDTHNSTKDALEAKRVIDGTPKAVGAVPGDSPTPL